MGFERGRAYCDVDFDAKRPLKRRSAGTPNAAPKSSMDRRCSASSSFLHCASIAAVAYIFAGCPGAIGARARSVRLPQRSWQPRCEQALRALPMDDTLSLLQRLLTLLSRYFAERHLDGEHRKWNTNDGKVFRAKNDGNGPVS